MYTRREVLAEALVAPLLFAGDQPARRNGIEIVREDSVLSRESAKGFARVRGCTGEYVVVCGAGDKALSMAPLLKNRAARGAWIVWESAAHGISPRQFEGIKRVMQDEFGIGVGFAFRPCDLYVEYALPERVLTRSFLEIFPVSGNAEGTIARVDGIPVAVRHRIGRGGIVFLGAMLGPNLYADEMQAWRIAQKLVAASD